MKEALAPRFYHCWHGVELVASWGVPMYREYRNFSGYNLGIMLKSRFFGSV